MNNLTLQLSCSFKAMINLIHNYQKNFILTVKKKEKSKAKATLLLLSEESEKGFCRWRHRAPHLEFVICYSNGHSWFPNVIHYP